MKMEYYDALEMEVICFETENDIITSSVTKPDDEAVVGH